MYTPPVEPDVGIMIQRQVGIVIEPQIGMMMKPQVGMMVGSGGCQALLTRIGKVAESSFQQASGDGGFPITPL